MLISSQLCLHYVGDRPFAETLREGVELHKKTGFDVCDITLPKLAKDGKYDKADLDTLLSAAEEFSLPVRLAHLPFSVAISRDPSLIPAFCAHMHAAIDAAAYLGVDYAVLHPNTDTHPADDYNEATERESVLAHLSPFVEHAERVGLKLAVENMRLLHKHYPTRRYCEYPEELCDIADTLDVSICWDFGHANLTNIKQSEALAYVGKRLAVLHVNDNTGNDDDHLPPYIGTVDWQDAMHGLALAGFDGIFNYETKSYHLPRMATESYARYLVDTAKHLITLIK